MKHIISYIILIAVSTILWSCGKSDDDNGGGTTPVKVEEPTWTVDLSGTESAPTTWIHNTLIECSKERIFRLTPNNKNDFISYFFDKNSYICRESYQNKQENEIQ